MSAGNSVLTFRMRTPLPARLVTAVLPALIGTVTWKWLAEATGGDQPFGVHPLWIYLWHPPLMDFLFGILVLAGFIETRRRWWLCAASLGLLSIKVHSIAVISVVNTQWLMAPLIDVRFAGVLPVTMIATIILTTSTVSIARLAARRLLFYSCVAGLFAGLVFVFALQTDTTGSSWFWRNNIHWMLWHASIATAIHVGGERRCA